MDLMIILKYLLRNVDLLRSIRGSSSVNLFFVKAACSERERHSCHNFSSVYVCCACIVLWVHASTRMFPGHDLYIYAWISK